MFWDLHCSFYAEQRAQNVRVGRPSICVQEIKNLSIIGGPFVLLEKVWGDHFLQHVWSPRGDCLLQGGTVHVSKSGPRGTVHVAKNGPGGPLLATWTVPRDHFWGGPIFA